MFCAEHGGSRGGGQFVAVGLEAAIAGGIFEPATGLRSRRWQRARSRLAWLAYRLNKAEGLCRRDRWAAPLLRSSSFVVPHAARARTHAESSSLASV